MARSRLRLVEIRDSGTTDGAADHGRLTPSRALLV